MKIKEVSVKRLAIVYVGLNVVDLTLTKYAITQGAIELNPIMQYMLRQPEPVLWGFKVGLATLFAILLLTFYRRFDKSIITIFKILVLAMVAICLYGIITILVGLY